MSKRAGLLTVAALVLVGLTVFVVWQRAASRAFVGLVAAPEVVETIRHSLADQRRLAAAFPEESAAIRARFADTYRLYRRLRILQHSRQALQQRYELILGGAVLAVLLLGAGAHLAGRAVDRRRLRSLEAALVELAAGGTDIRVGFTGRGALAAIGGMVERISATLSRQRARLSTLENLARWQEAARRHAHEMKTPLTSARLVLERAEQELGSAGPAVVAEELRRVRRDLQRLEELTRGFTEFSRLPAPRLEAIDLGEVARSAAETYSRAWPHLGIVPHAALPTAPIRGDRDLLEQLLVNLLENSARAMERAGRDGSVTIGVTSGRDRVELELRDDGPGVAPDLVPILFEPYVTDSRSRGGSGLGLAIARKIALDHQGDLELVATGPEGTAFRLTLPRRADAASGEGSWPDC